MTKRCPRCNSPAPHLHPAVQFEGEIEICADDFHLTPTPANSPSFIRQVEAKRSVTGMAVPDCETCSGNGWVDDPADGGTMTCPDCDGDKCDQCNGTGERP